MKRVLASRSRVKISPEEFRTTTLDFYDGEKILECGALVTFLLQIPTSVVLRGSTKKEVEWELENLGFDGAKVNCEVGFVDFCDTIEQELIRIGIHSSIYHGKDHISLDIKPNDPTIIYFYNEQFRFEISPIRAVRMLRSIKEVLHPQQFWNYVSSYDPPDLITKLGNIIRTRKVPKSVNIDMDAVEMIMEKYSSLTAHAKKGFVKWAEGDLLSMYELAKRM